MTYPAYTLAERPRLLPHFVRLHSVAWPSFFHDDAVNALWPRLYAEFPDYQIGLYARMQLAPLTRFEAPVRHLVPEGMLEAVLGLRS